jgi:hypothetical protein
MLISGQCFLNRKLPVRYDLVAISSLTEQNVLVTYLITYQLTHLMQERPS